MPFNAEYFKNIDELNMRKDNPLQTLINSLGPKGKLSLNVGVDTSEYDANAIQDGDIPEGMDEAMVTAILVGAMIRPDRLNKQLSNSSNPSDLVSFNQYYLISNIAEGSVASAEGYLPILVEARKEVKAALEEYKKGNFGPAKEMLERFIDFSNSTLGQNIVVENFDIDNAGKVYSAQHALPILADMVTGKEPINAMNSGSAVERARIQATKKQFEAFGKTAEIRKSLVDDFDAINGDKNRKEEMVLDLLFNQFVAGSSKQSIAMRDNEIKKIRDSVLEKYGINQEQVGADSLYDAFNSYSEEVQKINKDLGKVHYRFKINNIEAYLATEGGVEELKKIYKDKIKNTDEYKRLMGAKSKDEMGEAIESVDEGILKEATQGKLRFEGVKLPDKADKLNKADFYSFQNSVEKCVGEYEKQLIDIFSKREDMKRFVFDETTPEAIRNNAEGIYALYRSVENRDSFSWFGTSDQGYKDIVNAVSRLSDMAKEMGDPKKEVNARILTAYDKQIDEINKLADKYIADYKKAHPGEVDSDKVEALRDMKRALAVNQNSLQDTIDKQVEIDARKLGGARELEIYNSIYKHAASLDTMKLYAGEKYRNLYLENGPAGYSIGRWAAVSIATLALAATGKYTFDELASNDKLVQEKQQMFDEVVRRSRYKTPENQQWFAEKIYKGQNVITDLVDEAAKGLDYNDPDFEKSELLSKIEAIQFYRFDAWQEMSHCSKEIVALAQKDHPEITDYDKMKQFIGDRIPPSFRTTVADHAKNIRYYYMGMGSTGASGVAFSSFAYFKIRERVLKRYRENPEKKNSEIVDAVEDGMDTTITSLAQVNGLREVQRAFSDNPEIEKTFISKVLDGSLYDDVKIIPNYDTSVVEFDGLRELGDLFKTNNVDYIKEKLADKSYLDRNKFENRLLATREERYSLFTRGGKTEILPVVELSNEEMNKAAELFDKTFGAYLSKAGVQEYLAGSDIHMMDLFKVGDKSLREYLGETVVESILERGDDTLVKATVLNMITDPKAELKMIDFERDLKTGKHIREEKYILDTADRFHIVVQKPYLQTLNTFKEYFAKNYSEIDSSKFTDKEWNDFYRREFHIAAEQGLVPEDRITTLKDVKRQEGSLNPIDGVYDNLMTMYGPKQKFVTEWAASQTNTVYTNTAFLQNMIDVDPVGMSDDDFTTLAYFVAQDADVITSSVPGVNENAISHNLSVKMNSHKWTTDILAMGYDKPRHNMGTHYMDKINLAREATSNYLKELNDNNDVTKLAASLSKGIKLTLNNLKACGSIGTEDSRDSRLYTNMLRKLVNVVNNNVELSEAVEESLSEKELEFLRASVNLANIIDANDIARDKIRKAERGEIELSEEERNQYVEDMAYFDHVNNLWKKDNETFLSSPEYLAAAEELQKAKTAYKATMRDKEMAKAVGEDRVKEIAEAIDLVGQTTFQLFEREQRYVSEEFISDVMEYDSGKMAVRGLMEDFQKIKDIFREKNTEYKAHVDRRQEINNDFMNEDNTLQDYIDADKVEIRDADYLDKFGHILASKISMDQLSNIISRYNKVATEKNWTKLDEGKGVNVASTFATMAIKNAAGEKAETFYNLVFEEFEKNLTSLEGALDQINGIKTFDKLSYEEKIDHPYEKDINKLLKNNYSKSTKTMLRSVNEHLAERKEEYVQPTMKNGDIRDDLEVLNKRALNTPEQTKSDKIVYSDDVKNLVSQTVAKMKQYGMISGTVKAEQASKIYCHHKLLDAKNSLKTALKTGDVSKIDEANDLYEQELEHTRDLFSFVKGAVGDNIMLPTNLDTVRNKDVPPEFSYDFKTDSIINGIYVLAEQCERMGVTVEEYMNDPEAVLNKYYDQKIKENSFESHIDDNMTFAESMDAALNASTDDVYNQQFTGNVLGGSVGTVIGRPLDVLATLEGDSERYTELCRHKNKITKEIDDKIGKERDAVQNLFYVTDKIKRIGATNREIFREGLKEAFISGRPISREDIRVTYNDGRVAVNSTDSNSYLSQLKNKDMYSKLLNDYFNAANGSTKVSNFTRGLMVETMFDYLMEHPEDVMSPSYKELLQTAKKDPLSAECYKKYTNWKLNISKEANNLSKVVKNSDKEFDAEFSKLQKAYKNNPEIREEMENLINSRISELIDGYRYKEVSESYLKARYAQLMTLKEHPESKLPSLPKFMNESSPETYAKDLALINDRVNNRAWEGHLANIHEFATWRMTHNTVLNSKGEMEIIEGAQLSKEEWEQTFNEMSQEEWELAYRNEIHRQKIDIQLPAGVVDPKAMVNAQRVKDEEKRQRSNHEDMEDILAEGISGIKGKVGSKGVRFDPGELANNSKDTVIQILYEYGVVIDTDKCPRERCYDIIAKAVSLDVVKRRGGYAPKGMTLLDFSNKLGADECFRKVLDPLIDEVKSEAIKSPDGIINEALMPQLVVELINNHAIINAAAMEQKVKMEKGQTEQKDAPKVDGPGVKHIKKLIEQAKKAAAEKANNKGPENEAAKKKPVL